MISWKNVYDIYVHVSCTKKFTYEFIHIWNVTNCRGEYTWKMCYQQIFTAKILIYNFTRQRQGILMILDISTISSLI